MSMKGSGAPTMPMKLLPKRQEIWPRTLTDEQKKTIEENGVSVMVFDSTLKNLLEIWLKNGKEIKVA